MSQHRVVRRLVAGSVLLLGASAAFNVDSLVRADVQADPEKQEERLETLRAKGAEASVTIFPVVIWDTNRDKKVRDFGKDAAGVIGVMLESTGMDNLELSELPYLFPADVDFDDAAGHFGDFVRENPIETEYALYTEFLVRGDLKRFEEVRSVIVDKQGGSVWIDRQTPGDADFKRLEPDSPMGCCVLAAERVRGLLGLSDIPRKDAGEGRLARSLARKSGIPDRAEMSVMEERLATMREACPKAKVEVFPVQSLDGTVSEEGAAHLVGLLNKKGLCEAQAAGTPLSIELKRTHDEQKSLWDLARGFRDHVRQHRPEADYALFAEYTISPPEGPARTVHFVVCDKNGEWVIVDFQNSHKEDFQSVSPMTVEDCNRLVARRLAGYLR
jgi:hypothetical protein